MRSGGATLVKKVVKIYREEGLKELSQAVLYRITRMMGRRTLKFSFGDIEVKLEAPPYGLYKSFRYLYETERSLHGLLLSDLRLTDVFWDVGAHLGMYTLLIGKYLHDGMVVAFEPDPVVARFLKKNIALNNLNNVSVVEKALWNTDDFEFFDPAYGVITNHIEKAQIVECVRAHTLVTGGKVPAPNVVKIDVEGGEFQVLCGFGELLNNIRILIIEVHPTKGAKVKELKEMLCKAGFNLYSFGSRKFGMHETFWIRASRENG